MMNEQEMRLFNSCRMMLGWAGTSDAQMRKKEKRGELCNCSDPVRWCQSNKGPEPVKASQR